MPQIIKCNVCKLDENSCGYKCMELDDVSVLLVENKTEKETISTGFCTAHKCKHNPSGFKCELENVL